MKKPIDELRRMLIGDVNSDLIETIQAMINIFDRGIEPNTVGAKIIDKAKQAIEKALK